MPLQLKYPEEGRGDRDRKEKRWGGMEKGWGGEDRRGEDRRGEERTGEDRREENRRGEDRTGEERRGEGIAGLLITIVICFFPVSPKPVSSSLRPECVCRPHRGPRGQCAMQPRETWPAPCLLPWALLRDSSTLCCRSSSGQAPQSPDPPAMLWVLGERPLWPAQPSVQGRCRSWQHSL